MTYLIWRDGVARDLAEEGFEVVATADGVRAAVARAAAVRPDVVLMDMQLADGTGADATAGVVAASPDTRVLVLSASAERADVLVGRAEGMVSRIEPMLDEYVPALTALSPSVRRLAASLEPHEVAGVPRQQF